MNYSPPLGIPYPGDTATKWQILDLAHAYCNSAMHLFGRYEGEPPLSLAPARLCAIHAVELYLNAFLRHEGVAPEQIRRRMHNLADPNFVARLKLKPKTATHLEAMTERREYLVARYGPEQVMTHSELNRLTATLVEVMMKVGEHLRPPAEQVGG